MVVEAAQEEEVEVHQAVVEVEVEVDPLEVLTVVKNIQKI